MLLAQQIAETKLFLSKLDEPEKLVRVFDRVVNKYGDRRNVVERLCQDLPRYTNPSRNRFGNDDLEAALKLCLTSDFDDAAKMFPENPSVIREMMDTLFLSGDKDISRFKSLTRVFSTEKYQEVVREYASNPALLSRINHLLSEVQFHTEYFPRNKKRIFFLTEAMDLLLNPEMKAEIHSKEPFDDKYAFTVKEGITNYMVRKYAPSYTEGKLYQKIWNPDKKTFEEMNPKL